MPKRLTLEYQITKSKEIHDNGYDYSIITEYKNSSTKYPIICKDHGIFYKSFNKHIDRQQGCPSCMNERMSEYFLKPTHKLIEEFIKVHNNLYDYSKVVNKGNDKPIDIRCIKHDIWFEQTPSVHLNGSGCPECAKESSRNKHLLTYEELYSRLTPIQIENNDYSLMDYKDADTNVKIKCKIHNIIYEQRMLSHFKGHLGCPKCNTLNSSAIQLKTTEWFISQSKLRNPYSDNIDYSLVDYTGCNDKVDLICLIDDHSIFSTTAISHLNGSGCPKCGLKRISQALTIDKEIWIQRFIDVHRDRYSYEKSIIIDSKTKIEIICKKHNKSFWQTPQKHTSGCGCKFCKISKCENIVMNYLDDNNIKYEFQQRFDDCRNIKTNYKLPFDFHLYEINTIIEFDGFQHTVPHSFSSDKSEATKNKNLIELQMRDKIKTDYCISKGIKLLRISNIKTMIPEIEKALT